MLMKFTQGVSMYKVPLYMRYRYDPHEDNYINTAMPHKRITPEEYEKLATQEADAFVGVLKWGLISAAIFVIIIIGVVGV